MDGAEGSGDVRAGQGIAAPERIALVISLLDNLAAFFHGAAGAGFVASITGDCTIRLLAEWWRGSECGLARGRRCRSTRLAADKARTVVLLTELADISTGGPGQL